MPTSSTLAEGPADPVVELDFEGRRLTLLGTAHVSRLSAEAVTRRLESGDYDAVAIELCPSRHQTLLDANRLAGMDLLQVVRQGKAAMVAASLALAAYQQRLAEQFGIEPGAEMRAAIEGARRARLPVWLIDREVGITLRRVYRSVPWWRRGGLFAGLAASLLSREQVSEAEIERLKSGDMLESTFAQFAESAPELYSSLIDERDRYMAARLGVELRAGNAERVLVVVGAGHLQGLARYLAEPPADPAASLAALEHIPPRGRGPRRLAWAMVVAVLGGFAYGFSRSPELGWQLVADWALINGGLAALGTLAAAGHPLSIVTAFVAAPFTSLNPFVGAGMVTAAVELLLRRPRVGDFEQLRQDTQRLSGWWRNRVSRVLLVFVLSTLGSAIGTYVAGFRIAGRLLG